MATNIIKRDSVFAVNVEVTDGTYVGPASATDGYFLPQEGGENEIMKHNINLLERGVVSSTLTDAKPIQGMKDAAGTITVELRGSGTEGVAPAHGVIFESLFGSKHLISANKTSKNAGNTQFVLQIQDADIAAFVVNDIVVVKQTGEHSFQVVTAVDSTGGAANITVFPGRAAGSFANSVVISKSTTYKPADSGHPSYSVSQWDANTIFRKVAGARSKSFSISDFVTGKLATIKVGYEASSFDEVDGTAPHTPTYDSALPPAILGCTMLYNSTVTPVNEVDVALEQPIAWLQSVTNANGRISGRATGTRKVTGKIAPYKDDTSVAFFTAWKNGTNFSILFGAFTPSAVSGEFTMGSCFAMYLPQVIIVEKPVDDFEGILRDVLNFKAHGGTNGLTPEVAMAFI